MRLFGRLLAPAVTNVAVHWGGLDAVSAPSAIPPFRRRTARDLWLRERPEAATVTLTAKGPGGPLTFELPIDPSVATIGRTIGTLAARARIRELEESEEWTRARASRQGRTRTSSVTTEIIDLAVRYGLASRETSLVAIERRETPVTGDMELRRIPIAVTSGWGGQRLDLVRAIAASEEQPGVPCGDIMFGAGQPDAMSMKRAMQASMPAPLNAPTSSSRITSHFQFLRSTPDADQELRARVMRLAGLQRADGSWELTRDLAKIVGRLLPDLEAGLPAAPGHEAAARGAWATSIALMWLEQHAMALVDEWRLVARKATAWIDTVKRLTFRRGLPGPCPTMAGRPLREWGVVHRWAP